MVPNDALLRVITLPPVARAVQNARRWVLETATKWRLSGRDEDIELAVSELVTNANRHAQDGASVSILLMYAAGTLRLEVRDHDPLNVPLVQSPGPMDTHGWGLLLVAQCSERWGVRVSESGKTVWCELDMTQDRSDRRTSSPSCGEEGCTND